MLKFPYTAPDGVEQQAMELPINIVLQTIDLFYSPISQEDHF